MGNYESDTAFFGVVNNNATAVKVEEKNKKRAEEYYQSIEHAIQHSITMADIRVENEKQIEIDAEKIRKQRKLRIGALILAGVVVFGGLTYTGKRLSDQNDIRTVTNMATDDAKDELSAILMNKVGGSITFSNDTALRTVFSSLSTSDYAKLSVDNLGQIYSYKLVLGDSEFEEFIKSLTYLENGEQRHYVSFKQFLNINGFGSEMEFTNKAEAVLLEEYASELHKSKGGKQ